MKRIIFISLYITTFILILGGMSAQLYADLPRNKPATLSKPATLEYIQFDANQIRCWVGNNGEIVSYNVTGNSGLEWPKGSGNFAVFQSGLWVAGIVDGEQRSAAAEYTSEFSPGKIIYDPHPDSIEAGVADNPSDVRYQVSSINKGDSSDPSSPDFNREYATWPVADGAPAHDGEYFTDLDANGVWDVEEPFEDYNLNEVYDCPDGLIVEGEDPPKFFGDQTHWCVYNDMDEAKHANLWDTKPLGIEVQTTLFGFDRADPLGNVMFLKWLVINKSAKTIEDTYISMWSDPDLGDASDDYVGCDTSLSVGYCYNGAATDLSYGITPPCVGYDFFQGPVVPEPDSTALVSGRLLPGFRNLPMTSFVKYTNGSAVYYDPDNVEEAYNYMQGYMATGDPWIDIDGNITQFLYTGDPVTQTGYTEFDDDTPNDRRFLMNCGPFTMETWVDENLDGIPQVGEPGVQEIVGAIIVAAGTNNLNAIDAMKFFDKYAQNAYDTQFDLPSPPAPTVEISPLDKQVILSWEENADISENFSYLGYEFEGYNVYQGESKTGPWKCIATYDKVNGISVIMDEGLDLETGLILEGPIQFGTESGLARMISINTDYIRGNVDLINGRKYYYAVTTYAYNPNAAPKSVESSKKCLGDVTPGNEDDDEPGIQPHEPGLGEELYTETGEYLDIDHASGVGEPVISASVVDPLKMTGDKYTVRFDYDSTISQGSWYMGRVDDSKAMTDTLIQSTELDSFVFLSIDEGFSMKVIDIAFDPPTFNLSKAQTSNIIGTDVIEHRYDAVSPGGVDSLIYYPARPDTAHLDTLYGPDYYYDRFEIVEIGLNTYIDLFRVVQHDVLIEGWASEAGGLNHLAASLGIGGGITDPVLLRSDLEIRFTEEGQMASRWTVQAGYAPDDTLVQVPFEIWDVERDVQLCVGIADNNYRPLTGENYGVHDPEAMTLQNDWIVTLHTDYASTGDSIQTIMANPNTGWLFYFSSSSKYSVGDTLELSFLNPVEAGGDEYFFVAPALDTSLTKKTMQEQLKELNVFPNPYFAFNVEETNPLYRFVTFTHLPKYKGVIRIFSIGGQLVTKIDHRTSDFAGSTFDRWNLTNQYGIPVASGLYIAHIEVEGVGEKILKLAVFLPEERLDIY